jgi:hypothetical protein
MELLQFSVSKRRLNNSRSEKLRNRSIDNSWMSPRKLRLRSSSNMRISNRQNNSLSSSRSVDKSWRSPGKLCLSSSCNMRISTRQNSSLWNRRKSPGNLPLSSRCNMHNSLCNRRSPDNLHCTRVTRTGNLYLKMRLLTVQQEQPKYKPSEPMLSEANLKAAKSNCARLHAYVMEQSKIHLPSK